MDDFDDIVEDNEVVEEKRSKVERYIFIMVVLIAGTGIGLAVASPSVYTTVVHWFASPYSLPPEITYYEAVSGHNLSQNSTENYPTQNNSYVRFNAYHVDYDSTQWHSMIICNGTDANYTYEVVYGGFNFTCGGVNTELCRFGSVFVTDDPLYCDYYVEGWGNQTQNYTMYVVDSGEELSNVSGIFVVNRPPYIVDIGVITL